MRLPLLITLAATLLLLGSVGCEREITGNAQLDPSAASSACFSCHSDQDLKLVQARIQYDNSIHLEGVNVNRNHLSASHYRACESCHTSEGFLASLAGTSTDGMHFTAIDCFTCHQPHSSVNGFQVRITDAVSLQDGSTFDRGAGDAAIMLGRGAGDRFYPARGEFHLRNTCNTWTARVLASAGADIDPEGVVTADTLMRRARESRLALPAPGPAQPR